MNNRIMKCLLAFILSFSVCQLKVNAEEEQPVNQPEVTAEVLKETEAAEEPSYEDEADDSGLLKENSVIETGEGPGDNEEEILPEEAVMETESPENEELPEITEEEQEADDTVMEIPENDELPVVMGDEPEAENNVSIELNEGVETEQVEAADTAPPVLKSLKVDKTVLTAPGTILVTVTAEDNLSGIQSVGIEYQIEGSNTYTFSSMRNYYYDPDGDLVEDTSGTRFYYTMNFNEYANAQKYVITNITLHDNAGNQISYGTTNWSDKSYPSGSIYRFEIKNSNPDKDPPVLKSITLDKTVLTAPGKVLVTVTAEDSKSGLEYAIIEYQVEGTNTYTSTSMRKDDTEKKFTYTFEFNEYANTKKYVITGIMLYDKAGNEIGYGTTSRSDKPYPSGSQYRFEVRNSSPDTTAPVLKSITLDKTVLNAPGTVRVTITAEDDISGVSSAGIEYQEQGSSSWTNTSMREEKAGGQYYYQFTFNEYAKPAKYVVSKITLYDKAGNSVSYGVSNRADKPYPSGSKYQFEIRNGGSIPVSSVTLNKSSASIAEGDSLSLTATVSPSNATDKTVTWTSSNIGVATVSNGTVKGVSAGKATITASAGGKSATCTVTVNTKIIEVQSLELSDDLVILTQGETVTVTATVLPDNASNKVVRWSSSDPGVASVNNGEIKGIKEGNAVITATSSSGLKTAECYVTVLKKEIPLEAITFSGSRSYVMLNNKVTLVYGLTPLNTTEKDVIFTSGDESIATVDNNGTVTGKRVGSTTITVQNQDGSVRAECEVVVSEEKNGLLQDEDGEWRLYQDGEVRTGYTGLYPYGTSLFYLNQGVLDRSHEGIEYYQKAPYYVVKGQVTYTYTGLGEYKGSLHYFTNSVKDESYNGIAYYKGEPYFVVNGKVTYNYVGLGEYKGSLHYFTSSKKDTSFTGLSYYQGQPYYVLNGVVSYKYNGLGQYKEDWWYVVNSMVDKSYTGTYTWKGTQYYIKNGKVS